jgi:hypothetical protein
VRAQVEAIEDLNDGFQVEEMIEHAKDDLNVIPIYFKYRLWETADYDEFELEDEMQKAFGPQTRVVGKEDLDEMQAYAQGVSGDFGVCEWALTGAC